MKLLIAFGTRPEWNKIKPVLWELEKERIEYNLWYTGQHNQDMFRDSELELKEEALVECPGFSDTPISDNRLDRIIESILIDAHLLDDFTHVMVQGDTASAYGVALAAFHRGLKIIHLEAGLRSYDKSSPWPEESYRRAISTMADVHFCPTMSNMQNLIKEGIKGEHYVVGQTGLDNLNYLDRNYLKFSIHSNKFLVTLHRRENQERILEWMDAISEFLDLNMELKCDILCHPNQVGQTLATIDHSRAKVHTPWTHNRLLENYRDYVFVLTDSGGIQEECSFLNIPHFIARESSERMESITEQKLGRLMDPFTFGQQTLSDLLNMITIGNPCPFGNGHAAKDVVQYFKNENNNE